MRIEPSSTEAASAGRQPQVQQAAAAEEERAGPRQAAAARDEGPRAERSTRVTVSEEAKKKLAAEESGARAEIRKAIEDKGAVAKLLETQKERVSQPKDETSIQPAPTRPSQNDQSSIRSAEQRLASAGLIV